MDGVVSFIDGSPFVAGVLLILLLVLLRRHGLLYYGSKLTGFAGIALYAVLSIPPLLLSNGGMGSTFFLLILGIFLTETFLNNYTHRRRYFQVFDIGFLLTILALDHIGFLLLLSFYILRLNQMGLMDLRHFGALLLGVFSVVWFSFALTVIPTAEGINEWIRTGINEIVTLGLPTSGKYLPFYIAYAMLLTAISVFYYSFNTRALERHRFFAAVHLTQAWLTFLLQLLYTSGDLGSLYMCISIFFTCVMLQVFYRAIRDKVWQILMTAISLAALGAMIYITV